MDQHIENNNWPSVNAVPLNESSLTPLLQRVANISCLLEPENSVDLVLKKARFLAYELQPFVIANESMNSSSRSQSLAQPLTACDSKRSKLDISVLPAAGPSIGATQGLSRLRTLNQFFFLEKKFVVLARTPMHGDSNSPHLLHRVLSTRVGSATILALLYAWLAEQIGVSLQFVDLHPTCFLKYVEDGKSHFIDLSKNGQILDCDGLLEILNHRFKNEDLRISALLEPIATDGVLAEYLTDLRRVFSRRGQLETLLLIQTELIRCQPSNLFLLGERSVLHFKLGHVKQALADLKRYFAFTEKEKSPKALVQIYEDLISLTKHKQ